MLELILVHGKIKNKNIKILVDTGAEVSIINEKVKNEYI